LFGETISYNHFVPRKCQLVAALIPITALLAGNNIKAHCDFATSGTCGIGSLLACVYGSDIE